MNDSDRRLDKAPDVNALIASTNAQLRQSKCRLMIERRGASLHLRGTLPLKGGDAGDRPKQQRVPIQAPATADGVLRAAEKAKWFSFLLTAGRFDWDQVLSSESSPEPAPSLNPEADPGLGVLDIARRSTSAWRRTLSVYFWMVDRCYNPKNKNYKYYGGRGIDVCDRWLGPAGFINFAHDMGPSEPTMTIDRRDNNMGYHPKNCRWLSNQLNQRNRGNTTRVEYEGKTWLLIDLCEILDLDPMSVKNRLNRGMTTKDAIETPGIQGYSVYLRRLEDRKAAAAERRQRRRELKSKIDMTDQEQSA